VVAKRESGGATVVDWGREGFLFVSSIVYAALGAGLLLFAYKLFDWVTPFDLNQLICEENNTAAAIAVGAFLIAVALIIAAAIHG
jgi:putative membrane protein